MDHLKLRFSNDNVAVAFLYCNYKDNETQTPKDMLASLLKQLVVHRDQAASTVESLHKKFVARHKKPTISDLEKIIISVAQHFGQVFLIIDAMDECDQTSQRSKILSFIEQASQSPFKLLATSRPHPADIQNSFKTALQVEISAQQGDIELVVRNKISAARTQGVRISPELADDIVMALLQKGDGMYGSYPGYGF